MNTVQGTLLSPCSASECTITPQAAVRFGDDGLIAEVGTGKAAGDAVGDAATWVLPGFIDAHLHLPQWDRRGLEGKALSDWLHAVVYPAESRFRDAAVAERVAEDFVSGMIGCGTTMAAAFGSPFPAATEKAFEVFARRGFRAMYGLMLNDLEVPADLAQETDEALDHARKLAARWHNAENGRLRYAFAPRMVTCCSERLMRGCAELAKMLDCHVLTHVAESAAEEAAVRERYPDYVDDVDVFADMGLLAPRTLLGHGVCLSESQRRQVAETGTAVVHCPTANLFLESGLMDYVAHRRAGVPMALGSSLAAGPEPFMPQVAVACIQTAKALKVHAIPRGSHPAPTATEMWWLLTRGAAEALGFGDSLGALEAGYAADCLVVRPEAWINDLPTDEQKISALLYTLRPHQIEHVFIAGKRVGP